MIIRPDLLIGRGGALDRVVKRLARSRPRRDVGQRIARQRARIESLALLAEAVAARDHERNHDHREYGKPDAVTMPMTLNARVSD